MCACMHGVWGHKSVCSTSLLFSQQVGKRVIALCCSSYLRSFTCFYLFSSLTVCIFLSSKVEEVVLGVRVPVHFLH